MVLSLLRDKSLLLLSEEEYLILLAPASGVFLAITVNAICKYRRHQKRFNNKIFKFNKPIKTPVYNPIRDIVQKVIVLKVSYLHGKIILTCSKLNRLIFIMLQKSPIDFSFYTIAIWKTTEVVIVLRAARILWDLSKYLLKNKTNVLKIGINTLTWVVHNESRSLVYQLVFLGVSLSTAILWTYVPMLRRILRVWATITIFNLCSNIVVTDGRELWLEHGPQVTAFGLKRPPIESIEQPIPELKTNSEGLKSRRVILPGNETELRRSLPIRKKMKSTPVKDVTREHSEVSKDPTLSEKEKIVLTEETKITPKKETKIMVYEEKPIVAIEETPIVTNEETPIVTNEETTIVTNEETPIVTNEETTIVTNEETPIVTNEETVIVTNEETVIVTNEELPIVTNEELPIVTNEEPAIVTNEESAIVTNEEPAIVTNEESAIVTNEEPAIVTNEEATIVTNEEATIVTNKEATIVTNEELRKTNSTSKIKRTLPKSQTNNLQKLNEKFNPSGDDDNDPTPGNGTNSVQERTNYTKIREGKVR